MRSGIERQKKDKVAGLVESVGSFSNTFICSIAKKFKKAEIYTHVGNKEISII